MGKSSICFLFLIICACCRYSKKHQVDEVNYKVIIKVIDYQGYTLSGVIVNIKYFYNKFRNGNNQFGDKDQMTDGSGMITFTGKITKQNIYSLNAVASTQFNDITASNKIDGVADSTGAIIFNGKLQFTQSDVKTSDVFQIGMIVLKTFSNQKPLPQTDVQFTAIYSEGGKSKEVKFQALTNEKGEQTVRFLLPSNASGGAFIVLYTASKNEYWNTLQLKRDAMEFALWPEKKYELSISINLDPGQFKLLLTALVTDQNTKALPGAKLSVSGMNLGSNLPLESMSALTGADGKITITIPLKATSKIHIKESLTKDEYLGQESEFDQVFDLNVKKDSYTHDLGTIKLQEASGDLQISGTITDSSKLIQFVKGAEIIFTIQDGIEPVKCITDEFGKFKGEIYVPANQNLQLKATVKANGFIDKIAAPRQINVSSKQPLQITFDVVMDRKINNIIIKDKLVDAKGNPIPNAIVKIIDSVPQMPDKTLYNKEVIDKSDGTFEYNFACYDQQKIQATFVFQVPQFVPVQYKTELLECKNQDLGKFEMTLSKQTSILTIKGQVVDVDGKPMKGLPLKFKSDPVLQVENPNLISDANGNWQIDKLTVIPSTKYVFTIEYTNDNKQQITLTQEFTPTMDKEQILNFPLIGFQRFVKVKLSGKITPADGKAPIPLPLTITCDANGRDGKPIKLETTTKDDGSYSVEVEALAGADKPVKCVVTNGTQPSTTGTGTTAGTSTGTGSGTSTGTGSGTSTGTGSGTSTGTGSGSGTATGSGTGTGSGQGATTGTGSGTGNGTSTGTSATGSGSATGTGGGSSTGGSKPTTGTGTGSSTATASPVQPIKVDIEVKAPSWTSSTNIPVTYNSIDLTIKGIVSDLTKTINVIEGVDITLLITPQDVFVATPGKHLLEQYLIYKKHYQSASQSKLTTKSGKDGSYQFSFKAVQAYTLKFEIQASHPQFNSYDKKNIEEKCLATTTLTQNIEMDRLTMLTKLHSTLLSDKKPVPNAKIRMTTSDPKMADSKYYNVDVKDDDKGTFDLDFECYKDFDYVVELQIEVPQFIEQKVKSSRFKCHEPLTILDPVSITLQKIEIKAIIKGKVVDPHGKPIANMPITFTTEPESASLSTKTLADGTWSITDPKIYPNTEYKGIVTYQDFNKQNVKLEQKFTIQNDNQMVTTANINYQDYIDAKINGKIELEKGTISTPVTLNLQCPKFKDQKGDINKDFTTDKNGLIDITFQVLAKFDDKISCTLKTKSVVQDTSQNVELVQPNFEAKNVSLKSKLITTIFTIQGKLNDEAKLEDKLPGLSLTLTLKPSDPVTSAPIKVKSANDGTYSIIIETVRGISYEATINVDAQPQFQIANESIQLLGKDEKQSLSKDITLKRILIDCTVAGSLVDLQNQPIKNAKVEIQNSVPQMSNTQFYNKQVTAPVGSFSLPFQCYNQVSTTLKMDMQSDIYPKSSLSPQVFTCGEKEIKLKPIVVSTKTVQITVSGTMSDSSGVTKGVQNAEIEIQLTPSDPLASTLKTKSDLNGKYSLSFGAVQDQVYQAVILVTNQDFDPYKSSNFQITANKDQTITQDAQMNRIVVQATITTTITDAGGKTTPASKVTIEQLQPQVKGSQQSTCTVDATGKCTLKVSCYKNTEASFIMDITADKYKDVKSDKVQFTCSGPAITVPPVKVKYELAPTNTKLTLGGELVGPQGKGQANVPIKVTTDPNTKEYEAKTGANGKWSIMDDQLQFGTKYQITEAYLDASGKIHKTVQPFSTTSEQSSLNFPKEFYDDYMQFQVDGLIKTDGAVLVSNVPVTLQCDALGKDGKPIDLKTTTDQTGAYKFKWDMLINLNSQIDCLIISHETPKFKQTSTRFKVTPSTESMKFTSQAQVTDAFKAQLQQHYQFTTLKGAIVAECKQSDNQIVWKGLQDVNIAVKQWDGIRFVDLNQSTKSDKDGAYSLKLQVLKSQIQNEIQLVFTKKDYIPTETGVSLFSSDPQADGSYLIEPQNTRMVKIGGPGQCQ